MRFSKMFDSSIQYIFEAVTRIFGPSDDAYPATGMQPFTGEPFKQQHKFDW